jgi:hypothetical protein
VQALRRPVCCYRMYTDRRFQTTMDFLTAGGLCLPCQPHTKGANAPNHTLIMYSGVQRVSTEMVPPGSARCCGIPQALTVRREMPGEDCRAPFSSNRRERSPQQKKLAGLDKVSSLETIEIHPTRKIRTVKLGLVNSRVPLLIHQHRHLATKHIEDAQLDF